MTTRFDGRVAVIVGASRGIGKETAIQFAKEGGDVVLAGRSAQAPAEGDGLPGTMAATAEEIRRLGRRALVVKTDVTALNDVEEMAKLAAHEYGRIDVLINTAAPFKAMMMPFHEMPVEEWDRHINTIYRGALNCCRAVIPYMIKQHYGRIITITSTVAKSTAPTMAVYSSTRAAVAHFSKSLAREVAPHGITVNCVAPSVTRTDTLISSFTQEGANMIAAGQPIARLAEPMEIAAAILFLASEEAGYITGVHLSVDGGQTLL